MTDEPPGFGAILVSFPKAPSIGLDVSLSRVELTTTTWIREELLQELESSDPLLKAERRIDDNDLIIKSNIQRDQVKESDLKLDVFVGDEVELSRKLADIAEVMGDKAKEFRFPWQSSETSGKAKGFEVPFFIRDAGV